MSIFESSRKMTAREEVAFELGRMQGKHDATNWISVKERLPDADETVLCYSNKNGGDYFIGYIGYRTGAWCESGIMHIGDVTHWMPLLDPPKEEV